MNKDLIKGNITTLILSALKDDERYGYEIIQELELKSEGVLRMKEGTLYPLLHSLEFEGAIKSFERKSPQGRNRKYYKLTRSGRKLLQVKREEWNSFKQLMDEFVAREKSCQI
jgi:PadR family transcriptional regulator, regulatory protein PadR